jgi:nicotinamidase-related amidase
MLNDFLDKWEPAPKQRLIRSINDLVDVMRHCGHPVIWVRQEFEPDLRDAFPEMKTKGIRITIKGTAGCQIASDLAIAPSDPVVIKKRYSAFYGQTWTRCSSNCALMPLFLPELTRTPAFA